MALSKYLVALVAVLLCREVSAGCKPILSSTITSSISESTTLTSTPTATESASQEPTISSTTPEEPTISSTTPEEPTISSTTPEEPTISSTTSAEEPEPTSFGVVVNGGFEDRADDGEYTGAPWTLGRGVSLVNDPTYSHSGNRSVKIQLPIPSDSVGGVIPLTQYISGLNKTARYVFDYWWAFTDVQNFGSAAGGVKFSTYVVATGVELDDLRLPTPANQYFHRRIGMSGLVLTEGSLQFRLSVTPPTGQTEIRIDDVSVTVYDPPCSLISPPPEGLMCGTAGIVLNAVSNPYRLYALRYGLPFEDCAQECVLDPECKVFAYNGGLSAGWCATYSGTTEEIGFTEDPRQTYKYYEPGCWTCK